MLTNKYSKRGTIIGVVAAALFIAIIASSPPFQKCIEQTKKENSAKTAKEQPTATPSAIYGWCFAGAVHEGHGIITALATIVIGIFTFTLWRSSEKDLDYRRTYTDRAYVSGGLNTLRSATGEFRGVFVTANNYGKTLADVSEVAATLCDELPSCPTYDKKYVRMILSPGASGLNTGIQFDGADKLGKVVYGRLYYTDIFRKPHSYGFVQKILPTGTISVVAPKTFIDWD